MKLWWWRKCDNLNCGYRWKSGIPPGAYTVICPKCKQSGYHDVEEGAGGKENGGMTVSKRKWKTKFSIIEIIRYETYLDCSGRYFDAPRYCVMLREVRPKWRRGQGFLSPVGHRSYWVAARCAKRMQLSLRRNP